MKIELITAPAQLPVLLSEVRDFLKISHEDEDALLVSYIRAAMNCCENFIGRKLIAQQWQLTLNDWEEGVIEIPLSPILSVDKIEYWSSDIFQEISAINYSLDNMSYGAKIIPISGFLWPDPERDVSGIRITISAGFGDHQNAIPHDIRLGILHWIAGAYDGGRLAENQAYLLAERLWQSYRRVSL
ncbi:MAG: head-tail connector protein [Emcibacter sp.]|nr:head-tail connector protein [Emcibacter sp.]